MEVKRSPNYLIIETHTDLPNENMVEGALLLWKQLATHIISIMGEGGFSSLYIRSLYLTQPTFTWLSVSVCSPTSANQLLAELKLDFADQGPADIRAANRLLLLTFTDILSSLIGEELTARILCSAWGKDASQWIDKEVINE